MSKPIEGVSEKIETCAKKEFLDKGYVDASLRTIAAEAGTTTGSIYSRYGGKEGLFSALVEPAAKEFTEIFVSVQEKSTKKGIECIDYQFSYDQELVFDIDNFTIPQNEIVAITGLNGAGKTTFVRCLCGLEKKFKGTTVLDGKKYKNKEMLKQCYMVMQDVNHQLFCETVEDEISLGAEDRPEEDKNDAMEQLGVSAFRQRHPMSLSGGQKQRVAIVSAILAEKEILIFDEPTSGLDYRHMIQTAECFKQLKSMGKSVLIISHDWELINKCCTYEMNFSQGRAFLYKMKGNDSLLNGFQ